MNFEKDSVTPGLIQAFTMGLLRYMGTAREAESGAERPLMVMLARDDTEESEEYLRYFEESLETIGVEHADAGTLTVPALNFAFFKLGFDLGIHISVEKEVKIEVFERGDELGGLEASLPGGVNFEGKAKSVPYGIPVSKIGIEQIKHALKTEIGLEVAPVELGEDLHEDAKNVYIEHVVQFIEKIGPIGTAEDLRKKTDFSKTHLIFEDSEILSRIVEKLGIEKADEKALKMELKNQGKSVELTAPNGEKIKKAEIVDFIQSYIGLPAENELIKETEDGIILPGEPIPDGILTALLVCKILAR